MPGRPLWARPAVSPEGSHPIPLPRAFDGDFVSLTPRSRSLQHRLAFHSRSTLPVSLGTFQRKASEPTLGQSSPVSVPLHSLRAGRLPSGPTAPLDLTSEGVGLTDGQTPFRVQMA